MATLQELAARRDALAASRASGIFSARFGDDEVRYKSDREMAAAIADIDRQIAALQGKRVTTFLPTFSSGF